MQETTCNVGDPGLILVSGRSLEEGMATHSSILAWRIPWTEEFGGLQFIGSQRVDMTEVTQHACTPWSQYHHLLNHPAHFRRAHQVWSPVIPFNSHRTLWI